MRAILLSTLALSVLACGSREVHRLTETLPAAGITHLSVVAGEGELTITGVPGATTILARAEVASWLFDDEGDAGALEHLTFRLERTGADALLLADLEGHESLGYYADVTVTVPARLAVNVKDGDGDLTVSGVASLEVDDGPGRLLVEDVAGSVVIDDGTGDLEVRRIDGDVTVDDGLGDITVTNVTGKVTIDDWSGDVTVRDVGELEMVDRLAG